MTSQSTTRDTVPAHASPSSGVSSGASVGSVAISAAGFAVGGASGTASGTVPGTAPSAAAPGAGSRDVTAVVATRGHRAEMLERAVRSILGQDHDGAVHLVVVYDRADPVDLSHLVPEGVTHRTVTSVRGERAAGLAGGRNTGILRARTPYVAFCDDDDEWLPSRLRRQVDLAEAFPDAGLVGCGMRVETHGGAYDRVPPPEVTYATLLRSRVQELHPSGFLARTADLREVGMVDEDLPASYGEDYDLMLRLARRGPVRAVTEPLVVVHWDRASYFTERWQGIADGLTYLLRKHPDLTSDPRGTARIAGQVAFAHAALGDRKAAWRWARATLTRDVRQLRAWAALPLSMGLVRADTLVRATNKRGRGL